MSTTTRVTYELDREPTIADIQEALDAMRAEGIPDTFKVEVCYIKSRRYVEGVEPADRPIEIEFWLRAERSGKASCAQAVGDE